MANKVCEIGTVCQMLTHVDIKTGELFQYQNGANGNIYIKNDIGGFVNLRNGASYSASTASKGPVRRVKAVTITNDIVA